LAYLIDERDEILEHLEIAETKYIASFQKSTPDPSIADYEPPAPEPEPELAEDSGVPNGKPLISRPRPLNNSTVRVSVINIFHYHAQSYIDLHQSSPARPRKRRARNPAYASSSLPPTSYLMPSSFYKLRGVQGVGDQISELEPPQSWTRQRDVSFSDTINQRIVGSRFQEVNRNSLAYGRLPLGSHIRVGESGELGPIPSLRSTVPSTISDLMRFGPNHAWSPTLDVPSSGYDSFFQRPRDMYRVSSDLGEEWVDLLHEPPQAFSDEPDHYASAVVEPVISDDRRRPPRPTYSPHSDHRETFPLRLRNPETRSPDIVPPHLRIQPQQPFVRPISGMDHDELGAVYSDISHWRTRLKVVNIEIAEAQRDCYNDIADGARIKGWLMVGKGLRFLPGIELIEGRSKEDIKWDELQRQGGIWNVMPMWAMVVIVLVLLAAALTAVAGLILITTPDVAVYLTFLERLANTNNLATGIATVLCPTLAATLFITIAVVAIHRKSHFFSC
jgi:calcium permeable stress-gated cation channel